MIDLCDSRAMNKIAPIVVLRFEFRHRSLLRPRKLTRTRRIFVLIFVFHTQIELSRERHSLPNDIGTCSICANDSGALSSTLIALRISYRIPINLSSARWCRRDTLIWRPYIQVSDELVFILTERTYLYFARMANPAC